MKESEIVKALMEGQAETYHPNTRQSLGWCSADDARKALLRISVEGLCRTASGGDEAAFEWLQEHGYEKEVLGAMIARAGSGDAAAVSWLQKKGHIKSGGNET